MSKQKHPSGLAQYVGYKEINDAFGISTRTVQDMVRKGEFPQPVRHRPGCVGGPASFPLDEVLAWDQNRQAGRRAHLTKLAVTDPAKLAPEQVSDALEQLALRHVANATGRKIEPGDILGVALKPDLATAKQYEADALRQVMTMLAVAFLRMDALRAALVVAGFAPQLRTDIDAVLKRETGLDNELPQDELRALAADILHQALGGEFVGPGAETLNAPQKAVRTDEPCS